MEDERGVSGKSSGLPRSEAKTLTGEKRTSVEVEERPEFAQKRVKMRDLESVLRAEERTTTVTDLSVNHVPRAIDLNAHIGSPSNAVPEDNMACFEESNPVPSSKKQEMESDFNTLQSRGFGLDLNARDISSSMNDDPFHPYKNYENLKLKDDSECASSVGPLEEKDPMKVWREMKQNGFLSSSHGGVPMPKPRGRKNKNDGIKRKMELAKKEQVDRFAKIAAPTGLLNGLNPGIINHVRNSKQVHSIIEALVRSERIENRLAGSKERDQTKSGTKEFCELKDLNRYRVSYEDGTTSTFPGSRQTSSTLFKSSVSLDSELTRVDDESCMVDVRASGGGNCFSHPNLEAEDDVLALKLSSVPMASENASSLSNEDSGNLTSVTSLSVKAASVASQWLELLLQDIKGRLAALRRSKKRVRAVIHTELPFLLSKEFPSVQEHESCIKKNSTSCHSDHVTADAHRAKWNALFDQMDKTLSEEERQLECWLNQVREMQLHCEKGLLKYNGYGLQHSGTSENDCRLYNVDNSDRDLAVRAAAASIYSTCNYLSSMENLPCC